MTATELRNKYFDFFKEKGHVIIPSSSLLPENDPTTLFTGSGMQQMICYLLGAKHPMGTRIADSQKCFRAQDIEEVGDNRHTTMFEMLGNWSFGDYFKKEQIAWMFEFLTKRVGLDPKNLHVSVYRGNEAIGIPRDSESAELWKQQFAQAGIDAVDVDFSDRAGMKGGRIFYYDETKNWWSRSGIPSKMPVGEPGGPDSEMFWDFGAQRKLHEKSPWSSNPCHVNCDCGRFLEIGNNVFMEYVKTETGFELLKQKNVDFGGGLERIAAALSDDPDIFRTAGFARVIHSIEEKCTRRYGESDEVMRSFRIIADHVRAAVFLIGDQSGVTPSNIGQGYVVRRLLRRAVREGRRVGMDTLFLADIAQEVINQFCDNYTELEINRQKILSEISKEEEKFAKTLEKGIKVLEKILQKDTTISGEQAFALFSSYGFPLELTEELVKEKGIKIDREAFEQEFKKHQELSRTASAGMFKGGLADSSVETTRLHTATHLLHRALKEVLGDHIAQKGSNITGERLRFDFTHPQKLTEEQIKRVEQIVNDVINRDLVITKSEMTPAQAKQSGAIGLFDQKYGDIVNVYSIGDFSKEICGGPHVSHTGELGRFNILKEEAVAAGVRRIKATLTG
ncbi:MAG: alanine--tRNA ligase [Patescibacteria group bacterium]